jgi:hypothetical protein
MSATNIVKERPAEVATPPAMAVAFLICKLIGVDDVDTIGYVAILVAFVPAAVTWAVTTWGGSRDKR